MKNRLRGISIGLTENCKFGKTHFSSDWLKSHAYFSILTPPAQYDCSIRRIIEPRPRKPGGEVELFWLFQQNGGTVGQNIVIVSRQNTV